MINRFEKLKIAGTFVLAIFFSGGFIRAQTGTLKLYVYNKEANSMLKNWKMKIFIDDSLCKDVKGSDENGLVLLSGVRAGTHSLLLRPDAHPDQRAPEVEVYRDSVSYFTFSITQKNHLHNGKH